MKSTVRFGLAVNGMLIKASTSKRARPSPKAPHSRSSCVDAEHFGNEEFRVVSAALLAVILGAILGFAKKRARSDTVRSS